MLVVMKKEATEEQVRDVVSLIKEMGLTPYAIPGGTRVSIGILFNKGPVDPSIFVGQPGVKETIAVTKTYKLVSREFHPDNTIVRIGDVAIGDGSLTLIAGPCAIESMEQAMIIAKSVKKNGAQIFRGGAFKPRTSPYSFQGLGIEGLHILAEVRKVTGMPVVTEVMDIETFDVVEAYADIVQIGTRNMQNFSLLRRAGESRKPVLLKRGMAATIEEWLMAAEYILQGGNANVILCERGVRSFANHSRSILDLSAVIAVKKETHLPVIVDPSHAAGYRDQVPQLSRAAVAADAHGIMVEVHHDPPHALSDGAQSLYPEQFQMVSREIRKIYETIHHPSSGISNILQK